MKNAFVYTAEGRLNTKSQRQRDIMRSPDFDSAPDSYTTNSIKEDLCLEYINTFLDQFTAIYPKRRVPYMVAENEFGVRKFVGSTLRATQIPVPELYDLYECASFLAGYILYEPLDPPTEPPKYIFSPQLVLDSNTGDSFDLANLLCSFLLGAGYDAYMVFGYAPQYITLKDQSRTMCPLLGTGTGEIGNSSNKSRHQGSNEGQDNENTTQSGGDSSGGNYIPPDNSVKNSKYLQELAEKKRLESIDTFQLWIQDAPLDESKMMEQEKLHEARDKRVHSWVVIRPGSRDVKETLFVEPSTGRVYSVNNSPYIGIEAIWNNQNFFVNSIVDSKVSEIDFANLKSEAQWEPLFLSASKSTEEEDGQRDNVDDLMENNASPEAEMKTGSSDTTRYFEAPPKWSVPLNLPRAKYLVKYPPNGKRTVQYYCAKADFFAKGVNEQSMVMRITLYLNRECTIVKEIHEWFENRTDRMYKRVRYFLGNRRFVEFYNPGSRGEVKRWTEYPGKGSEIDFYVNGRLDRLMRREEVIGQSVTEIFSGRTDLMCYRQVLFSPEASTSGSNARRFVIPKSNNLGVDLHVSRMTLKFEKHPTLLDGSDIAKRVFIIKEAKAVFHHHFAKSQVTGKIRTFFHTRSPLIPVPSDQALSQEIGLDEDTDAQLEAATLERETFAAIKNSFQIHDKLSEARLDGELKVESERTVFERALDSVDWRSMNTRDNVDGGYSLEAGKGSDFLTPYLKSVSDPSHLSREDALSIRQACLDALKARLVERASIIQNKLHEENAKLGKKQELFQRSQREGDFSTEEYEKYCTEAMFRIQILEQRLTAHEESAPKKYAELDLRLSNDPRLRVLKT